MAIPLAFAPSLGPLLVSLMSWIDDELQTLDLDDDRLDRRQKRLLECFASQPKASIPVACDGWAETQAAYRFFAHPRVTGESVLQPHRDATVRRMAAHPVVLLPQDTTELDLTRPRKQVQGAGPMNWEQRRGFFQHAQLAVTPERLTLGVIAAETWGRDPQDYQKNDQRKTKPIEDKESYRWLQGYRRASALVAEVPGTQIISLSDREGDIYECFLEGEAREDGPRADWIIRACQNRSLPERVEGASVYRKLRETVAATSPLGRLTVQVPRSGRNRAREAVLTVRSTQVELKPPYRQGHKLPPTTVNVVLVHEDAPPEGVEAIDWLLLTNLSVDTYDKACLIIDYYTCRWQVEVFFRVYKSGCLIEKTHLESETRLMPCLSLYLIVAWRILWLTMLGRTSGDLPCDTVFAEEEWRSVWTVVRKEPAPADPPPLATLIKMVARLGGHLGRTGDGPPGPQVMWIGIQRMRDFAIAWQAFGPRPAKE